ncbi:helix-turn-helix domain-containing protein [Nevskia soli]|uniref:helix-turn-helix domain-containing protein n=1 Tax=Nevskia soli TaxID=418856 RepID=UPI0009FE11EC|nr:helix-turn-helix domain-containing protein [Nevskia soli]
MSKSDDNKALCHSVADCLDEYFSTLNGHAPKDLYETILGQVEPPLLRATLRYCDGNQSRAADLLGLNRATLRKKLSQYKIAARSDRSSDHQSDRSTDLPSDASYVR